MSLVKYLKITHPITVLRAWFAFQIGKLLTHTITSTLVCFVVAVRPSTSRSLYFAVAIVTPSQSSYQICSALVCRQSVTPSRYVYRIPVVTCEHGPHHIRHT